jgi:hypothetical protein
MKEYKRMKGLKSKYVASLCAAGGLAVVTGCDCYRNLVDPCYPDRYEYTSRREVIAAFAPQVYNGHVLDQTIWNYQFEPGTDKLTAGGMEHLTYLARRRPYPDCVIYLATAYDIPYDPAAAGKYAEQRASLDQKRMQAIQNYMSSETAGRQLSFEVIVHDPPEVGLPATAMGYSIAKWYPSFQGAILAGVGPSPGAAIAGAAAAGAAAGSVAASTAGAAPPAVPPH